MAARTKNKIYRLTAIVILFAAVMPLFPGNGETASLRGTVREANRLYGQGRFSDSLGRYEAALKKSPESDIVHFNAGAALYKQDRYDEAMEHFQKAVLSDEPALRQRAHYNLGNSFYKSGIAKEKSDIGTAIKSLEESLQHFSGALDIDKKDQDAQYNYEFVKKELERLRQEQKQQQQQESSSKESKGQQQSAQEEESAANQREQGEQSQEQGQQEPSEEQKQPQAQEQPISAEGQAREGRKESVAQGEQPAAVQEGAAHGEKLTHSAPQSGALRVDPEPVEGLTPEEAQRLLQHYSQTEEPQGLLHVFKERHETAPVLKDW